MAQIVQLNPKKEPAAPSALLSRQELTTRIMRALPLLTHPQLDAFLTLIEMTAANNDGEEE